MPTIYDNKENYLNHGLKQTMAVSKRVDFCVGYFNLRRWNEVAKEVDGLPGAEIEEGDNTHHRYCRLLVGMQKLPQEIIREHFFRDENWTIDNQEVAKMRKRLAMEFREQLVIGPPSDQDENAIRTLARQLKEGKVVVKLHLRHLLHAKLYLAYSNHAVLPAMGFLGSSNLTLAGLSKQGELNIDVVDNLAAAKLVEWFEDRWEDRWCIDITQDLIEILENSWAADKLQLPYHIYLKVAYHLSREARAGISEFKLARVFQNELLKFQQTAVLVAAKHELKRGGGVLFKKLLRLERMIMATASFIPKNETKQYAH